MPFWRETDFKMTSTTCSFVPAPLPTLSLQQQLHDACGQGETTSCTAGPFGAGEDIDKYQYCDTDACQLRQAAAKANDALYRDLRSGALSASMSSSSLALPTKKSRFELHLARLSDIHQCREHYMPPQSLPKSPESNYDINDVDIDFNEMARQQSNGSSSSVGTSTKMPGKSSEAYDSQVLSPRGITASECVDRAVFDMACKCMAEIRPDKLKRLLGEVYVDFDNAELIMSCSRFERASEAEWTASVYCYFFLKASSVLANTGILLRRQPTMTWLGPNVNICPPPPVCFDRRASLQPLRGTFWLQHTQAYCRPDHCFYVYQQLGRDENKLPAMRGGAQHTGGTDTCPPYLITEAKCSDASGGERAARQYLAFVMASLLHEKLLLWHMTEKAQANTAIPSDDEALQVFGMTNCGKNTKIFRMNIRRGHKSDSERKERRYARYDLMRLADLDLTKDKDCEELKMWMNYIHYWGLTVHKEALSAKAAEAVSGPVLSTPGYPEFLSRVAFYYDTTTTLKFEILTVDSSALHTKARSAASTKCMSIATPIREVPERDEPDTVQSPSALSMPTRLEISAATKPAAEAKVKPKIPSNSATAQKSQASPLINHKDQPTSPQAKRIPPTKSQPIQRRTSSRIPIIPSSNVSRAVSSFRNIPDQEQRSKGGVRGSKLQPDPVTAKPAPTTRMTRSKSRAESSQLMEGRVPKKYNNGSTASYKKDSALLYVCERGV
ncbi:hypothetical protein BKA65DRAFT_515641 [Rhexocercosporidium sp. MPI-PUGE-AT-0058]|nr:hypothetical protein BKA65DRAFT_515641 [Rhexocercosporidium sp. MPI-PUGE-AT-0058]